MWTRYVKLRISCIDPSHFVKIADVAEVKNSVSAVVVAVLAIANGSVRRDHRSSPRLRIVDEVNVTSSSGLAQPALLPRTQVAGNFNRFAKRAAWLGFALALIVLLGAGLLIMTERRSEIEAWRHRASSLSSLLALAVGQSLTATDNVMTDIVTVLSRLELSDPADIKRMSLSPMAQNMLAHRSAGMKHVAALGFADAAGEILTVANRHADAAAPSRDLASRLVAAVVDGAPIREPYIEQDGRKVFPVARPLRSRDGLLLAIVFATVDVAMLERYADPATFDGSMAFALVRRGGEVFASVPPAAAVTRGLDGAALWSDAPRLRGGVWTPVSKRLAGQSGLPSGVVAATPIEGLDFVSAVLIDEARVLARWRNWSVVAAAAALAISTLLVMFTLFVSRVLVWQDRMLAEVAAARDAAETASRAKTSFLSLVSHEFRTPLSALIGSADLLGMGGTAAERAQYANIITAAARQLLALIDNVLGMTRLEHQKFERKSAPFSLRDLMGNAMIIGRTLVGSKKIELDCIIDQEAPDRLVGDAGAFSQVVLNLVSNAVKYTPQGQVRVRVSVATLDPLTLRLVVTDTGIGISPDMLGRLFQPFERGNSDRVRVEAGTGLGLAITERLVGGMGGTIAARNNKGGGATFAVELPFVLAGDERDANEEAMRRDASDPLHILLVEDAAANRLVLKAMLESMGHTVTTASDGQAAVAAAAKEDFDLIVMDVQMPVMDGYEATRRIRAMERHHETPMIALTAFTEQEHLDRAREAGLDRVLPKPARLPELAAVTRAVTPRKRVADGAAAPQAARPLPQE